MLKRVCDRCGSDHEVETLMIPKLQILDVRGGIDNAVLCKWYNGIEVSEVDLCDKCKYIIARYLESFLTNSNDK